MKAMLKHFPAVINVIASLCAIFGITIAPFFLDLTDPVITVPLAAFIFVIGMYLGYKAREKVVDAEAKKEIALKEYEDKKAKEESELSAKKKREQNWNYLISYIKHMEYDTKKLLYAVLEKKELEITRYSFVDDKLILLFEDNLIDYENCGMNIVRWTPTKIGLKIADEHPELFSDVKRDLLERSKK